MKGHIGRPATRAIGWGAASVGALLAAAVCLSGCKGRDLDAVGAENTPFILLLSPEHDPGEAGRTALAEALSERAGMHVEVVAAPSSQAAVTRAGTDRYDAAILPLFDYLFCHLRHGADAGLQLVREQGATTYRSEILVRQADGPASLEALGGKRVAFVDRYSTSGFLFPAALLASRGVKPDAVFLGTHGAALAELRAGRADAAATFAGSGPGREGLKTLATTEPIPNEPVFFRRGLDRQRRARFSAALVDLGSAGPGRKLLVGLADATAFVPATQATYDPVQDAVRSAGRRVEDLVPHGWRIRHEDERSLLGDFAL